MYAQAEVVVDVQWLHDRSRCELSHEALPQARCDSSTVCQDDQLKIHVIGREHVAYVTP